MRSNCTIRCCLAALAVFALYAAPCRAKEEYSEVAESFNERMTAGKITEAEQTLAERLKAQPSDDEARFALGIAQTMSALEGLMQSLYKYGLDPAWASDLPFVRLPVPKNPSPDALTNKAFREIVAKFESDLAKVETTLAPFKSADVKLPVMIGSYRLDFDGDGKATDQEAFYEIFNRITRANITAESSKEFVVLADKGDVHWLRGYCRLLRALCEINLAYDTSELHDLTAQLFFPHAEVKGAIAVGQSHEIFDSILDAVAFIHLLQLPVAEPARMETARQHILAAIGQSRESWQAILAETDDDLEWIPSPKQKIVAVPGARVSEEMLTGWNAAIDEAERILNGEKLIPFWRKDETRGVNLKRVFTEPTKFDLVLWVQGSAALPYLEKGEVTDPQLWNDILNGFQGQFLSFAIWVN